MFENVALWRAPYCNNCGGQCQRCWTHDDDRQAIKRTLSSSVSSTRWSTHWGVNCPSTNDTSPWSNTPYPSQCSACLAHPLAPIEPIGPCLVLNHSFARITWLNGLVIMKRRQTVELNRSVEDKDSMAYRWRISRLVRYVTIPPSLPPSLDERLLSVHYNKVIWSSSSSYLLKLLSILIVVYSGAVAASSGEDLLDGIVRRQSISVPTFRTVKYQWKIHVSVEQHQLSSFERLHAYHWSASVQRPPHSERWQAE